MKNILKILVILAIFIAGIFVMRQWDIMHFSGENSTSQTPILNDFVSEDDTLPQVGDYDIRNQKVVYLAQKDLNHPMQIIEVKDAEPRSLIRLRNGYATDDKQVFFEGRAIAADPISFESLGSCQLCDPSIAFARDSHNVYINDSVLQDAHADTFQVINNTVYQKDDVSVYYKGEQLVGADPLTFQTKNIDFYAKDAKHVYYKDHIITEANTTTFTSLKAEGREAWPSWGRDAERVYFRGETVPGADGGSFVFFPYQLENYARDKNRVYFGEGKVIYGADPHSFTFPWVRSMYTKDAKNIYYQDALLPGVDQSTFTVLGYDNTSSGYAKDKRYVYYQGKILEGARTETFELFQFDPAKIQRWRYAHDDTRVYDWGKLIPDTTPTTFIPEPF